MKKKGFTLIELLAVIVILAIIALIATPIVMNVIENSRKGAAERSAENYIDAVELAIASKRLEGTIISDGTYDLEELESEDKLGTIEVNGNKPTSGTIKIVNGTVATTSETTMTIGDYTVSHDEEGKVVATKGNEGGSKKEVYRRSNTRVNIGVELSSFEYVENPSSLGDYYLKHVVENNKVTESYACVKLDDEEEACIRGGNPNFYGYDSNKENYTGNALILKDLNDKGLNCDFYANFSFCTVGSFSLEAWANGEVRAYEEFGACYVDVGGSSYCSI